MTNDKWDLLGREYKKLIDMVWKHFVPECNEQCKCSDRCANDCLHCDLQNFLLEGFDKEDIKKVVGDSIKKIVASDFTTNAEEWEKDLIENINWSKIERNVEIRSDFYSAFKEVERGWDLSGILDYSLTEIDLKNLAELHKANKCRRKIEELLESVNFHVENADFANKRYDKYLSISA